jgi:hypothetical protein
MRKPWPPLPQVEDRLNPPAHSADIGNVGTNVDTSETAVSTVSLPLLISDRVQQITAASRLNAEWPRPGLVIRCGRIGICLDKEVDTDKQLWVGWATSPDTDYATNADVLLEENDAPFDPYASVIQTWNSVTINVIRPLNVFAVLSPTRLDAIRSVATEVMQNKSNGGEAGKAGRVFLRSTGNGLTVLTGEPLGDASDPRHHYQKLYREAALAVSGARFSAQQKAAVSIWQALQEWLGTRFSPAYGLAATAMIAVVALMLIRQEGGAPVLEQIARAPETKTEPAQIATSSLPSTSPIANTGEANPTSTSGGTNKKTPAHPDGLENGDGRPKVKAPTPTNKPKQTPPLILLASLNEAMTSLPIIRGSTSPQTEDEGMAVIVESGTIYVLRIIDRDSVPKALALLSTLGIPAAEFQSPVPSIKVSLPKNASTSNLERDLLVSGLFKPRSSWLHPEHE